MERLKERVAHIGQYAVTLLKWMVLGGIITVNTDTAAVLKADYSVFAQMAQLVEVTTTKD